MVWRTLTDGLAEALRAAGLDAPGVLDRVELAVPRDASHGDWTTNLALGLAKTAKKPPRAVAEAIAAAFPAMPDVFGPPEVAGPGFLNFRYSDAFLAGLADRIRAEGPAFGTSDGGRGVRVLVEYVSANPTGPLNIVSARAAAVGAALVRLLAATGHDAAGEFYVNDAGNQVDLLGESLRVRFGQRIGRELELPENGYQGAYLADLAAGLPEEPARAALDREGGREWFREQALERMLAWQQHDLADYGASFERWFRESSLHASGAVGETLRALEERGVVYRAAQPESGREREDAHEEAHEDGRGAAPGPPGDATWLRTTAYGDGQDRVVVRANGVPTYLLPDMAYHRDKRARGFRHAINLWGPDHHAYVRTMKAALGALGLEPDFLEVLIVQQVNLLRDEEQVKMSKRLGNLVTLRELMDEVGADCAKFFFLMRSTGSHLDFDLDLAKQQNDENPAYYVQYAHARIASVLRYAEERGLVPPAAGSAAAGGPGLEDEEKALVRKLAAFPEVVRGAAAAREPHRIPTYLTETAAQFHRFYHFCRVVGDDRSVSERRLALCDAARQVVANGLSLMGVTAPQRMDRAVVEAS